MAVRATPDNLSLDYPSGAPVPEANFTDFAEVWAHRENLRQACTRMIGDPARAEDLVQETFLSAIKSGRRLEPRDSMGPWLATVARRRSIDELRGRRWVAPMPTPPEPKPTILDDPAEQFLSQELVTQLRTAIAELTPRERQLLLRQATYGLSLSDLAAEEETSVASVRSVLTRARQKVRTSLERGGALGGLPIPRWLLNLRDKAVRSAYLWEPTLPSLTGAGAQAVVAIVAAVAMLIGGMTSSHTPEHSLTMIGSESTAPSNRQSSGSLAPPDVANGEPSTASPQTTDQSGPRTGGDLAIDRPISPDAGLIPTLPNDGNTEIEQVNPTSYAASETGGHVFALSESDGYGRTALHRSTDSGATWTRVEMSNPRLTGRILIPPTYPAQPTIFAVSANHVLRSDDAGSRFVPIAPAFGSSSVLIPPDYMTNTRLLIGGRPLLEYDVTERTLRPLEAMPPIGSNATSLLPASTYATDRALLVAGMTHDSNGTTVATVSRCAPSACGVPVRLTAGSGLVPHLLKLSSGVIIARQGAILHRSLDEGATFHQVSAPQGLVPAFLGEGPAGELLMGGVRYGTGQSGMARSTDSGDSWHPFGLGTDLATEAQAMVTLPNGALIVTPGGFKYGILCSHDDGGSWSPRC